VTDAPPLSTGEQLLAAILAAPDDDAPRLAYADWLDEHGEPERASFIRVQCKLARLPRTVEFNRLASQLEWDSLRPELRTGMRFELSSPRDRVGVLYCLGPNPTLKPLRDQERDLLRSPRYDWLGDLPGWHKAWGVRQLDGRDYPAGWVADSAPGIARVMGANFVRGFVGSVACPAADWLAFGDAILAGHPVREVRLTTWPELGYCSGPCVHVSFAGRKEWVVDAGTPLGERERFVLRQEWPAVETWHLPGDARPESPGPRGSWPGR
jgi:uncharacterized protein (TIGR02996 family)